MSVTEPAPRGATASAGPLRVAVVGVGIAGESHLLDAVTTPALDVVAVCARRAARAEAAAHAFGVAAAYADVGQMLAQARPDAVVIATPPAVMAAQAAACLAAGAHVLLEKPMATRLGECRALAEACAAHGAGPRPGLAVAYTRRYRTAWHAARQWVADGRLGTLRTAECRWSGPYRERYASDAPTYRADPAQRVAGVLLDTGSHVLDAVQFVVGAIGEVVAARLVWAAEGPDVEAHVCLRGPGGTTVRLAIEDAGSEAGVVRQALTLEGTAGRLEVDDDRAVLHVDGAAVVRVDDGYVARPVDDLVALHARTRPLGAGVAAGTAVVAALLRIYATAGHPLAPGRRWQRPRAKALARLSGAC